MVKHILIVDDQHEVRRMLKAGIETLGPEYQVLDLPSAEESLVVISIQPVDLLITDIGLPGMSGLELLEKVRKRNPGLKLILITGLPDPKIRQQVTEAGAEAFFIKPVQMVTFLDAVQKALRGTEFPPPIAQPSFETTQQSKTIHEQLTGLRQELGAEAMVLLNEWGEILAQTGKLPVGETGSLLIPSLLSAISAGGRLSIALSNPIPESLLYVKGSQHDLYAINTGLTYILLVLMKCTDEIPGPLVDALYLAVQELLPILAESSSNHATQRSTMQLQEETSISPVEEEKLEQILSQESTQKILPGELDQFWDNLAEDKPASGNNTSVITYEQARKLGLTPDEV
jgi:DNA-binding NarL/FixJ family response regulator